MKIARNKIISETDTKSVHEIVFFLRRAESDCGCMQNASAIYYISLVFCFQFFEKMEN